MALILAAVGAYLWGINGFVCGYVSMDILMLCVTFPKSLQMIKLNFSDIYTVSSITKKIGF